MNLWQKIKAWPVWRWALSFLKSPAENLIKSEGDKLRAQVLAKVQAGCPGEVDALFDAWEKAVLKLAERLPEAVQAQARLIVMQRGDSLRQRVKDAACSGGVVAINAAFDGAEAALIAQIEAL